MQTCLFYDAQNDRKRNRKREIKINDENCLPFNCGFYIYFC